MNSFHIRRARVEDAQGIIRAHIQSIREVCSKDYTQNEIAAWSGKNFQVSHWEETIKRDFVWVVQAGAQVEGFGHLAISFSDVSEIMGLYFSPKILGKGLGKDLLRLMIQTSTDLKMMRIDLHSTLTAKTFYETFGFKEASGSHFIEMAGVKIPCRPMELYL